MVMKAIIPGKHTSRRYKNQKVYYYLVRNLTSSRPNQVWATGIIYIMMEKGYMFLIAIIEIYSRYVINWRYLTVWIKLGTNKPWKRLFRCR